MEQDVAQRHFSIRELEWCLQILIAQAGKVAAHQRRLPFPTILQGAGIRKLLWLNLDMPDFFRRTSRPFPPAPFDIEDMRQVVSQIAWSEISGSGELLRGRLTGLSEDPPVHPDTVFIKLPQVGYVHSMFLPSLSRRVQYRMIDHRFASLVNHAPVQSASLRPDPHFTGKFALLVSSRRKFDPDVDYYAVLRVEPAASRDEITRSYRQLMRVTHPDRFSDPTEQRLAEDRAKDLNAAYAVLSRPDLRRQYDQATRDRLAASRIRKRYATPRSTTTRRPTYTQQRSASRPRASVPPAPTQRSNFVKASRQILGTFLAITLALMLAILLLAAAIGGLRMIL